MAFLESHWMNCKHFPKPSGEQEKFFPPNKVLHKNLPRHVLSQVSIKRGREEKERERERFDGDFPIKAKEKRREKSPFLSWRSDRVVPHSSNIQPPPSSLSRKIPSKGGGGGGGIGNNCQLGCLARSKRVAQATTTTEKREGKRKERKGGGRLTLSPWM